MDETILGGTEQASSPSPEEHVVSEEEARKILVTQQQERMRRVEQEIGAILTNNRCSLEAVLHISGRRGVLGADIVVVPSD